MQLTRRRCYPLAAFTRPTLAHAAANARKERGGCVQQERQWRQRQWRQRQSLPRWRQRQLFIPGSPPWWHMLREFCNCTM